MKTKVVIIGGKGTAVVIAEQIYDAKVRYGEDIEVLGFAFDDSAYAGGINGWPVLCGTREAFDRYREDEAVKFVFAMYRSDLLKERITLRDSLGIPSNRFLSFIHPSACVAKSVMMGEGNIILANVVINSNVQLGNFNTILSNSMIAHDTTLGNNNFVAAHSCIGSGIQIGNGNFTGLNCSIRTFVKIGDNNLIGMASNVISDFSDDNILVGNPAKALVK